MRDFDDSRAPVSKPLPNEVDQSQLALNEHEWGSAREILLRARALVERQGWQQGSTGPVQPVCVATALESAWLQGTWSLVDFDYARAALTRAIGVAREESMDTVQGVPDVPYWGRRLVSWNDDPNRTQQDVLKAFSAAASLAEELRRAHRGD